MGTSGWAGDGGLEIWEEETHLFQTFLYYEFFYMRTYYSITFLSIKRTRLLKSFLYRDDYHSSGTVNVLGQLGRACPRSHLSFIEQNRGATVSLLLTQLRALSHSCILAPMTNLKI